MRITNNFIQRNALAQLQANLKEVSDAQRKVSSGLRIEKPSDDPAGADRAMRTRGSLRALEQYRRNVDDSKTKAALEESVLGQINDLLTRAKELGVAQASDSAGPATRADAKAEIDVLLQQAISLGNTKFGDQYLFGGKYADEPPFAAGRPDFLTRDLSDPPTGTPQTEIAAGRYVQSHHDGHQVFVATGFLASLAELSSALGSTDDPRTRIANALAKVDSSFGQVQSLVSETGARVNQLEVTGANLDAFEINLQTLKSNLEEVDLEKAVTELVSRQSAFQAAMLATSRVMGLTLADYLR